MSNSTCLCSHQAWLHMPGSEGEFSRGRCNGTHSVMLEELPDDIDLTERQAKHLERWGYILLECSCRMFHQVEIPDLPQLVDAYGRKIHGNGRG